MTRQLHRVLAAGVVAFAASLPLSSHAVPVAVELSLLVDVSGSVSASEFALQRDGYVQAFQSAAIQNAIVAAGGGGIAVNYVQWSSGNQQQQSVGWTLISNAAQANAFAAAVAAAPRAFAGATAPGSAINFAAPLFNNDFEGTRQVIDVSGDGVQNNGADTSDARDAALAGGITAINGLAIGGAGILDFYQNNIVGGTGSFAIGVSNFADFAGAVTTKIGREVTVVPEPGSLALLGIAAAALGLIRRRRHA